MKKFITIIMTLVLADAVSAFVLIGPGGSMNNERTLNTAGTAPPTGVAGHFQTIQSANLEDPYLGTPKDKTRFFRVNTPYLTYGFDQSFMQFFGSEGTNAVDQAMRVINDFFEPEDKVYDGVSGPTGLDLTTHGFSQNFATYWLNVTAENENLIDIRSVTLGYMVNRLGLGNPHRYAYTAYELDANYTASLGVATWKAKLNNYDPLDPFFGGVNNDGKTDIINNVQYSYRLVHNQPPNLNLSTYTGWNTLIADMEEYTDDTSGYEWSAVSGIIDAFYGNTLLTWVEPPSQFNFGVYYDGMNASGGQYQPRHALTLDDAGGLKYLYSTNTIAMEFNPYRAVSPADYVKGVHSAYSEYNALERENGRSTRPGNEVRIRPNPWQPIYNPTPRAVFPIRNGGGVMIAPGNPTLSVNPNNPLYHLQTAPYIGSFMHGTTFTGPGVGKMAWAYRGGINKIKMVKLHYDSLLDTAPDGASFVWKDTFITNLNVTNPNTVGLPGAGNTIKGRPQYFTQIVGRNVTVPDFLFSARNLTPINGVPIAFEDNATFDFNGTTGRQASVGGIGAENAPTPIQYATGNNTVIADANGTDVNGTRNNPQSSRSLGAATNGPGIWAPAETRTTFFVAFNSEYNIGGYEVVWQGETSVDGNRSASMVMNQQWAHIYGPGATDFKKFPDNTTIMGSQSYYTDWENSVLPVVGKPTISVVSRNGGNTPIGNNSFYRTQDSMTIRGSSFRNATAIEIIGPAGDTVQTIYPVSAYIKSDSLIEIPTAIIEPGTTTARNVVGLDSEGTDRRLKVWNTVGASELNPNPFAVKTGRVVLSGTSHDGTVYYADGPLTLYGYGFESALSASEDGNHTVTSIQIADTNGNPVWPADGTMADISNYIQKGSDTKLYISGDAFPSTAYGLDRVIRVSRSSTQTLSVANGRTITIAAGKSIITGVTCTYVAGSFLDQANSTAGPDNVEVTPNNTDNPLRRDARITITGTGLYPCSTIQLVRTTGSHFLPPVEIDASDFVTQGIVVNTDGTQITMSANAFQGNGADGFGSKQACLVVNNGRDPSNMFGPFHVNIQPTVTGLTLAAPQPYNAKWGDVNTFNRGSDEVFITGTGLGAIKYVRIQATDSKDKYGSPPDAGRTAPTPAGIRDQNIADPPPTITLDAAGSTPGAVVDVTGTTLKVNTGPSNGYGTASFTPSDTADANHTARWMEFKLQCEDRNRTCGFTYPDGDRFLVGITPRVTNWNIGNNFRRDADNATLIGQGLRLIDELEFVDQNNVTINPSLIFYPMGTPASYVDTSYTPPRRLILCDVNAGLRLDLNGSVIAGIANANALQYLADDVTLTGGQRLIKVTTPFGVTQLHTTGGFTPFRISGAIQFSSPLDDPTNEAFVYSSNADRWVNARTGVGGLVRDDNETTFSTDPLQDVGTFLSSTLHGQAINGIGGSAGQEGGGYDFNGTDTAQTAVNNTGLSTTMRALIINGSGFQGVSEIEFRDLDGNLYEWPTLTRIPIDPSALAPGSPVGITVSADGTKITITGTYIHNGNNTWARQGEDLTINGPGKIFASDRYIRLFTPSGDYNDTPLLDTNATNTP